MTRNHWFIFMAVVVLFLGGLVLFNKQQQASLPQSTGSQNIYGNKNSPVTLTEFIDFQCEACYAYYPTMKQVKEKYKDRVAFQVRHFPISTSHKYARMAAGYAEGAARQGKFWEMHDKIFEGQKQWERTPDATTYFDTYAKELGLDMQRLQRYREGDELPAVIKADLDAVRQIGGDGTPTFALNGKKLEKVDNSVESFSQILDNALKR